MDGDTRRERILETLAQSNEAKSANYFAKIFGVSRQIIVGDIALLRAQGHDIVATARGYSFQRLPDYPIRKIIAVNHTQEETRDELELLVKLNVIVVDVIVEHPVYGEIRGNLDISTQEDVEKFLHSGVNLLSSLTNGIHLHTILCTDLEHYNHVLDMLKQHQFLYENN